MTTPARLPLENLVTEQRVWDILHANEEIGLAVDAVWDRPHRCGIDFSCPLTWRTSRDRGMRIWRDNTTVGWSMGAMSSCDSCALGAWDNARSYLDAEHQRWSRLFLLGDSKVGA
ncbi:hypothetical protein C8R43DRAFT_942371 [Mycena crocata]|nr:hypothetical protein C8R43DRAFT_942371 [Mycena crocata]